MSGENSYRVPCDPGWNDPPLFSYDSHYNHVKKSLLNKGTEYCHETTILTNEKSTKMDVKSANNLSPPLSTVQKKIISANDVPNKDVPKPVDLEVVLKNLKSTIEETNLRNSEKEANEINRRLALMERMWNEDKFPDDVKSKLANIAEALQENDLITCDNLQRSLMVDYTSLCSSWMAAIRLLINSKRLLKTI